MSKGARKSRFSRDKRSRRTLKRVSQNLAPRTRVLIVGEGKAEANYFRSLRKEEAVQEAFTIEVNQGSGGSPRSVVEKAMDGKARAGEPHDEVWCVLDTEGGEPSQRAQAVGEAVRLAVEQDMRLCWSNPCFEVWFLAHFERTERAFADASAVVKHLGAKWQAAFGGAYEKSAEDHHQRLAPYTNDAIANGRWVREERYPSGGSPADRNSSTEVYRLVERLLGRSAE